MEERIVLAVASSYDKKYYLNEDFEALPQAVKDELKIICVLFTENVGGTIELEFDDAGNLNLISRAEPEDLLFDEIGSHLKIKQLQIERKDLFESLETFFKVFYLGEDAEEM